MCLSLLEVGVKVCVCLLVGLHKGAVWLGLCVPVCVFVRKLFVTSSLATLS